MAALLKPMDRECANVDATLYRLHFGQYFRFDISTQLPYFYKSVQKLLSGLCVGLTHMWQKVWSPYFSLTPFDPDLIHGGSDDRRTDALVETCAVFTGCGLLDMDHGGAVQQEYLEVAQYFKRRWSALQESVPAVEDIVSMWMSYPHWDRKQHLRRVVDLVFGIVIVSPYVADFVDDSRTALDADTLVSSLHFVRSWFRHSFAGRTRRNLQGLLRVTESSDMFERRLTDVARAKPWDQLLKVGLDTTLAGCESVLTAEQTIDNVPAVDDYRSNILAQLSTADDHPASPVCVASTSKGKPSTVKVKRARTQSSVKLQTAVGEAASRSSAKKKSSRGQGSSTRRSVGRRTGGKPRGPKTLVLSTCSGSSDSHVKRPVGRRSGTATKSKVRRTGLESSDDRSGEC